MLQFFAESSEEHTACLKILDCNTDSKMQVFFCIPPLSFCSSFKICPLKSFINARILNVTNPKVSVYDAECNWSTREFWVRKNRNHSDCSPPPIQLRNCATCECGTIHTAGIVKLDKAHDLWVRLQLSDCLVDSI